MATALPANPSYDIGGEVFFNGVPSHIGIKKVEFSKNTIKWQVASALEMMKNGETPRIDISKLPKLAGPVPQRYFDDIKEGFGEDVKNLIKYFINLVSEEGKDLIAEDLAGVLDNPGDTETMNFFLSDFKKYSNGKEVSQTKLNELKKLTKKMGIDLNKNRENVQMALLKKREEIKIIEKKIENAKIKKAKLKKLLNSLQQQSNSLQQQSNSLQQQSNSLQQQSNSLQQQINKIKKEIKEIDKQIKERGGAIDTINTYNA